MDSMDRRDFLGIAAFAAAGVIMSGADKASGQRSSTAFDVEEKTIQELQAAMRSGQVTAAGLASAYLARIRTIDKKLNSVIEVNPDALTIARQMDRERAQGKVRGALHGIPVILKDNIDTADKVKTTA